MSESAKIGKDVRIGPFSEIGPKAEIGDGSWVTGAAVEGKIGRNCRIWRGAHVMEDAELGDNVMVANNAIVLSTAKVGDNTCIQLNSGIARLAVIGKNVYIGCNVVFANAKNPTAGASHDTLKRIEVKDGASVGSNAVLIGGVTVGEGAVVGACSVVTRDVAPHTTVVGAPAMANYRVRSEA